MHRAAIDVVVKVGGSLYELPDLAMRLRQWLGAEWGSSNGVLLVPGGGVAADAVRRLDHRHGLGEEKSHWLALRALTLNAHFLASLLPGTEVIEEANEAVRTQEKGIVPIFDVHKFARRDEAHPDRLPHSWAVTSDALAARVACALQARDLVLLKSTTIPNGMDWNEAGRLGLVDELFADVVRSAPRLCVRAVNLRTWPD